MMGVLYSYVIPAIHVFACFFLIVVVLLQTGKGADMGAVFGGGSQTLFGSSGAGNFLTKLTTATAITFMLTSLQPPEPPAGRRGAGRPAGGAGGERARGRARAGGTRGRGRGARRR